MKTRKRKNEMIARFRAKSRGRPRLPKPEELCPFYRAIQEGKDLGLALNMIGVRKNQWEIWERSYEKPGCRPYIKWIMANYYKALVMRSL